MKKTLIFQYVWVLLVFVCTISWRPTAAAQEFLVVGVMIREREVATIEVVQQGEIFFLPLESFARLTGSTLERVEDTVRFITPIGIAEFKQDDIRLVDGIAYIGQHRIKEKLHISK